MIYFISLENPTEKISNIFKKSWQLMYGHKRKLLVIIGNYFIPYILLAWIVLSLYNNAKYDLQASFALIATPYIYMSIALFYQKIKT